MAKNIQSDKKYGSDWAKSKSRDLVRDMIERTLLKFRKPKDLHVLCFPGIDAAEVYEVYDHSGIPRGNIYGIERDREIADELERKNLGIQVVRGDLEDYLASQESLDLDIVSLDYTNPLSRSQLDSLEEILTKQTINHFLYHQVNLARRDSHSGMLYNQGQDLVLLREGDRNPKKTKLQFTIEKKLKRSKLYSESDLKSFKSDGITGIVGGTIGEYPIKVFDDIARCINSNLNGTLVKRLERELSLKIGRKIEINEDIIASELYCFGLDALDLRAYLEDRLVDNSRKLLSDYFPEFTPEQSGAMIFDLLIRSGSNRFQTREKERYSYISESGSPMLGEVIHVGRSYNVFSQLKKIAGLLGFPNKLDISDKKRLRKEIIKFQIESEKFSVRSDEGVSRPRQFLGSSARPVLTKQKAIEEFKNGASVDEVREKYRGVNGKPLAQWKAHVTMGTYGEKPIRVEEELAEHEEDSDLEKITKEEAIDLLSSGIPLDEIERTYPTSFSKGQLKAFKAHITMGTYEI